MCSKTFACPRPTGHVVAVVAAAIAVAFLHPVFADDEKTPVHFVAKDGIDQGDCSTPQEPCATIDYALGNAATGDEIRAAAGVYSFRPHAPAEIAALLSSEVTVRGGFSVEDMFQSLDDVNPTVLVTPDSRYADRLQVNGFVVRSEAQLSRGAPRLVSEDGSDSGDCDNMDQPCASITYALTQAQPGNAVLIASGTYFVPETAVDDLLRADLMVRGGFLKPRGSCGMRRRRVVSTGRLTGSARRWPGVA